MRRRDLLLALGLVVLGAGLWLAAPAREPAPPRAPLPRLLGPFAGLGADLQWIRFQRATLAGDHERALALASVALELAPERVEAWERLSNHLALNLASTRREPDPAVRRGLFEAGLRVLSEGRRRVARPGRLWFSEGLLLLNKAEFDPELAEGGSDALLEAARAAFLEARALGVAGAADFVDYLESGALR